MPRIFFDDMRTTIGVGAAEPIMARDDSQSNAWLHLVGFVRTDAEITFHVSLFEGTRNSSRVAGARNVTVAQLEEVYHAIGVALREADAAKAQRESKLADEEEVYSALENA